MHSRDKSIEGGADIPVGQAPHVAIAILPRLKTMKNYKHAWLILTVCQAVLLSGCTSALWEKERFARRHWPADPPNLRLFYSESARDILVEYNEALEGATTVQRRAYWLERNALAVAPGGQPRFISVKDVQNLAMVPVTDSLASPLPSACHGLYAIASPTGQFFSLCLGEKEPTIYELPVSFAGSGRRVKQVLLTPFAVATDVTILGGVVCLLACYGEANSCLEPNYRH